MMANEDIDYKLAVEQLFANFSVQKYGNGYKIYPFGYKIY